MESNERIEVFRRTYELPMYAEEHRFRRWVSVVSTADFAIIILLSAAMLAGQRLDDGMSAALNMTAISLGIVILSSLIDVFKSAIYTVVSTYVFLAGAFCTAVALALILYRLSPIACYLFVPWIGLSVVVVMAPLCRLSATILRNNKDEFTQVSRRWRQELRAHWRGGSGGKAPPDGQKANS
jgi:hypothetical protein